MADELPKEPPESTRTLGLGTKEIASRDNDVIAGDDDLVERGTDNARVAGEVEPAVHHPPPADEED